MGYGSTGRLLRVDLTHGAVSVEQFDEAFYRLYPGGKALAGYLLLREIEPGVDPLGPDNVLVLVNGLLTGAPISTATRFTASARSPLSGAYGESEAGGFWGPELKMAGYEGIIVTGRAEHPVYIAIRDDQVEIRDARHLWGQEPEQAQAIMREELNDRLVRVLQIGAGGEHMVRFAALINDLRHFNGRTGMGAVMGSKNLKGIAVRGSHKFNDYAHDPAAVSEIGRRLPKRVKEQPQSYELQYRGTPGLVAGLNAGGILPTRNFHAGAFEGVDNIKWEAYEKELLTARRSCYACAVRCKREVSVNDRYQVTDAYGGPEYETVSGFGSNCGIDDLQAIAKANELCGRYTLDAISTSSVVAFAMECYEHGLIGPQDTGGLELRFGDAGAMLKLVEMIAHRQGIGDLLADGVRRAAEVIGGDARAYAMHVKGQELPMHDPRGKVGVGLGYAIAETGADHLVAFHDSGFASETSVVFQGGKPLGITEPLPPRDLGPKKAALYAVGESWSAAGKVIGFCYFGPAPRSFIQVAEVVEAVHAATGWDISVAELLQIGERAVNLARVFNAREGFSRKDDVLPDRLFGPLENGALEGIGISRAEFDATMTDLYRIKGWDAVTAMPTRERLEALGIGWAADLMK
jgi:aldehyde:ferredoxin oxidoreductase